MSRRLLTDNVLSLACLQAINYAAPLITLPYLVRVLQPEQFGLLSFAQGIVLYFDFFTDFGFNMSATRSIAACRDSAEAVSRIFWSTLLAKSILMLVSGAALALLVAVTPRLRAISGLFAVNALYLIGTTCFPVWLFQGLERMKPAVGALGVGRLLTVPALILLVRTPQDYVVAAAIQASVELSASLLSMPLVFRRLGIVWAAPRFIDIKASIKQAWPLFISGSALFLSTSSTVVILGSIAGELQVGYFSAADKLIRACNAALGPLCQAIYPRLTVLKTQSSWSALQLIRKSLFATMTLALVLSIATGLLAPVLCRVVLGGSFRHSSEVLAWLSPLPILYGLISVFGTQTLLVFEMDKELTRIMLAGTLAGIPLTAFLGWRLGAIGAAISSVSVAMAIAAALLLTLHKTGLHVWKRPASLSGHPEALAAVGTE